MTTEQRKSPRRGVNHTAHRASRRSTSYIEQSRSMSFGEWIYNHRIGIFAVILVFILSAATLAMARYHVTIIPPKFQIEVITEALDEELEKPKETPRKIEDLEQRMEQIKVQNLISNDASDNEGGDEGLSSLDAETQEMLGKIADDAAKNYSDYHSGIKHNNGPGSGDNGSGHGKKKGETGRFSGRVTVAYEFKNPVRHHRDLFEPAYTADGAGEVIVEVYINRDGRVIRASVTHSTNKKLNAIALSAARHNSTYFDINPKADELQKGTITYTFVAQ